MSCNGCRVLRKGCNNNCILRQSLASIETPQAQANATVFLAKFFGRAGLLSFLSAVPHHQRPPSFQSLLFEACGRTVNPVNGAVGLLWTGNWHLCQLAVETVLGGGSIHALPEFFSFKAATTDSHNASEAMKVGRVSPEDLELGLASSSLKEEEEGNESSNQRTMEASDVSETTTSESSIPSTLTCSHETKQLLYLFL